MADPKFIHLHVHTAYSLSEGALPIKKLAGMAKALKMPALAATDTSNLFGALEFSEALVEKGIQPIIGLRLRVDLSIVSDQTKPTQTGLKHHTTIVLLAKNEDGYKNLLKLSSSSFLEVPDNAEPHVPWTKLEACADGLICLTGGPEGPLNESLFQNQITLALQRALQLKDLFGDRLYIELQRHGTEAEQAAESGLIEIAYDHQIPLVATNQC